MMSANRSRLISPLSGRYYGAALATALLFWLLSAYVVWQARATDYASAGRAEMNVARLVADDVGKSLAGIDALLKSIGRQYVDGLDSGPGEQARLAEHMKKEIADFPVVARVLVADPSGRPVLHSGEYSPGSGAANVSDRAAFRQARGGDRGLIFDGPVRSKFADEWVILALRRLEDTKGDFLGVVGASIPVESFTKLFSTIDSVERGVVALWTDDGVLVARYGGEPGADRQIGVNVLSEKAKGLLRSHPEQTSNFYDSVSSVDGVRRLFAYQKLPDAPFLVVVGQPKFAIDQPWRRLAIELGLICLAVTVAAFWMARRLRGSAARLKDENEALEQRVAERTAEIETKNRALIASERKFSDAMQSAPNPMALFTPDGRFLEVNAALCAALGYRREELMALDIRGIVAPGKQPPDPETIRRFAAGALKTFRAERRYRHKDGRQIPVQVETSTVMSASGEIEYLIAQGQDISARLDYEEHLRALLDSSVDGVHILDLDGAVVEFSPSFAVMLGYSRDEIKALNVADIVPDKSASELKARFREVAESGEAVVFETRHRRKDGSILDVEISARAVTLGGKTYLHSSSRDIGERVRMQRRLEEKQQRLHEANDRLEAAERRLKEAVAIVPAGFAIYDADDRLVVWNEATLAMYPNILDEVRQGASYEQLLRIGFDRGHSGEGATDKERWVRERMERHRRPAGAFEQLTNVGRWLRVEERRTSDGGVVVMRTDITELKARERELAEKTALLEATLHNMGEGLAAFDSDGALMIANEFAIRLVDLPPDLARPGARYSDILRFLARSDASAANVDVESFVDVRMAAFRAQKPFIVTRRIDDGRVIETRFNPTPGGGGVYLYRDVTENVVREAKLAEKTAILEATLENIGEGIVVFDADRRLLVDNAAAAKLLDIPERFSQPGAPFEEAIRFFIERGDFGAGDVESIAREFGALFEARRSWSGETRLRDGRVIENRYNPMPDGGGIFVHRDVTERRRAELALEQNRLLLQEIIDKAPYGIAVFDENRDCVVRNANYGRVLDLPDDFGGARALADARSTPVLLSARRLRLRAIGK